MSSLPGFPNHACKTSHAFADYWRCLVANSNHCPFAFGFGHIYLCKHQYCKEFACQDKKKR